jgi:methionyl-tRNA formyltransferase
MAKKLDAGKMYAKREYEILESDNNTSLFEKLSIIGRDLLLEVIEDVYNDINLGVHQNEEEATFSSNITKEEEKISFNDTSLNIFNKIRGLSLEPGAYLEHKNVKLKVFASKVVEHSGNETPGTVLCIKKKIIIKTLDKAIELTSVLMPGKKIMTGQEFSNGQKLFELNDVIQEVV